MKFLKREYKRRLLLVLMLFAFVLTANVGASLAKYTSGVNVKNETNDDDLVKFYFSSDIAEENGVTHPWYSGIYENGLEIKVYNYERDNVAMVSEADIVYSVTVADCTVVCYDSNGDVFAPDGDGNYTLSAENGVNFHTLFIKPNSALPENDIEVSITSSGMYVKTLSVTFDVDTDNREIDYTVVEKNDRGEYILVTVYTNAYLGDLNVAWSDGVAPDNTDPLMREWINTNEATIDAKQFSTYEMIFFKLDDTYTITVTRGAE